MGSNPKLKWFQRFQPDGRPEPPVARGDNGDGEVAVVDDGWFALFKDGRWRNDALLYHEQLAEFMPVQDRDEIYRLFNEARAAFGLAPEEPSP